MDPCDSEAKTSESSKNETSFGEKTLLNKGMEVEDDANVVPKEMRSAGAETVEREIKPKRKSRSSDSSSNIIPSKKKKQISKSTNSKRKDTEQLFQTTWICSECQEAECTMNNNADELLICDGQCQRLFHYPCAGLPKLPADEESFICLDCTNKRHACSYCQEYGADDEDVFKCNKDTCGLFFHEACLQQQFVEFRTTDLHRESNEDNTEIDAIESAHLCVFVCPAHTCWTCTHLDVKEQEDNRNNNDRDEKSNLPISSACIPVTTNISRKIANKSQSGKKKEVRRGILTVC
jgi:hypothetical protein